jgi:DNA adenine methylase
MPRAAKDEARSRATAADAEAAPVTAPSALRPILKWAGGKSKLVPQILARLPETIATYHEPFVGGAAVFFALASRQRFKRAVLSDANQELVDVYRGVQKNVSAVIKLLSGYEQRHCRDVYYETREQTPSKLDLYERAARLIYLNKTGYNGLYRVNQSGQFNVPMGRYTNPTICDQPRLRAAARALKSVKLELGDFGRVLSDAQPGDAVYFDPPYVPLSKTSSFTAYHSEAFGDDEHRRLADVFALLTVRGIRAVLSNSNTPLTRKLYPSSEFYVEHPLVARAINSKSALRGEVKELLVSNAEHVENAPKRRRKP